MFIFTVYQIFKFAFQGFWRNFWLSVVTITVIVLSFLSINFLVVINKISESVIDVLEDRVDISIYVKKDTNTETLDLMENELRSISQVANVKRISEKEALENFRQKHKIDTNILQSLEELDENPLGVTFIIKAKNIDDYSEVMTIIDRSKFHSSILDRNYDDNKFIIEKINTIVNNVTSFGILVTSIFIVISILIVLNTIKLAIYTHQKEIAIMKLVGASDAFISFPYIIESILYAIFGCVITVIVLFPFLSFIQPYMLTFFAGFEGQIINVTKFYQENFFLIFGIQLIGVIVLNIIASGLAIRRYLRM